MKQILSAYPKLEKQRQALLQQLTGLPQLRRGSVIEQFLMVKHADGSRVKRGPYPLLTRKDGKKTVSLRLSDPALVALYRQQIQAMRQFETVVDHLVRLGEQLSDLAVAEVVQKKLLLELEQTAEVRRECAQGRRTAQQIRNRRAKDGYAFVPKPNRATDEKIEPRRSARLAKAGC